jgi:CheY-like chemotaxis protein
MKKNSIWIVDDDSDDQELIRDILSELDGDNEAVFFNTAKECVQALEREKVAPFIIMCDVNIPGIDGFALREMFLKSTNRKFHSVPFIFWSTYASEKQIEQAYRFRAHGFFIKDPDFNVWKESFAAIINYWRKSKMPSKNEAYDEPLQIN